MAEMQMMNLTICKWPPCYSSVIRYCITACLLPIAVAAVYMVLEGFILTSKDAPIVPLKDALNVFKYIQYLCFAHMAVSCFYFFYRSFESVKKMIERILICVVSETVFLVIYYIVWAGFMMFFAVIQSNLFGLAPFQQ